MLRDYDIFEKFPDGSTVWRGCAFGQFETQRRLQSLAEHSANEFFAIDIQAGETLPMDLLHGKFRKQIKNEAKRTA